MKEIWRTIKKNVQANLSDLDKTCSRTNRELVYGAIAWAAMGMVLGLFLSPKKTTTIGSNNGNNNSASATPDTDSKENED